MKKVFLLCLVFAAFSSCRNLPDFDELSYKAFVVTNHDSSADFTTYSKYFLPPSIGSIGDDPNDSILDNGVAQPILNAIDANMQARGFVKETNPFLADLAFNVVTIKVTTVATMYPGYWWGYYGWYYPYYPYYPYSYTYSYSTGSLIMDIVDVKNVPPGEERATVLWTNFSNGVLGVNSTNVTLAVEAVNQAFAQSLYIQAN
jgi:hypothetical protein